MNLRQKIVKAEEERNAAIKVYNEKIKEIQLSCDHPSGKIICYWDQEQNDFIYRSPLLICKCCGYTEDRDGLYHHPSFQKVQYKTETISDRMCLVWSVGKIKNQRLLYEVYHCGKSIDILFD